MVANKSANSTRIKPIIWYSAITTILVISALFIFLWIQPNKTGVSQQNKINGPAKTEGSKKPGNKASISGLTPTAAETTYRSKPKTSDNATIIPDEIAENMKAPAGLVANSQQKDATVISFIATSQPIPTENTSLDVVSDSSDFETLAENFEDESHQITQPLYAVEEEATFQGGGLENFRKYVLENYKIDQLIRNYGNSGKVTAMFVVGFTGNIEEVKIITGLNSAADNEMIRVLTSCPPWKPAKQRGKLVRQKFILPLSIALRDEP